MVLLRDPVFPSPVEVEKRGGRLPGTSGRGPGFFGPLIFVVWVGVEKGLLALLFLKKRETLPWLAHLELP